MLASYDDAEVSRTTMQINLAGGHRSSQSPARGVKMLRQSDLPQQGGTSQQEYSSYQNQQSGSYEQNPGYSSGPVTVDQGSTGYSAPHQSQQLYQPYQPAGEPYQSQQMFQPYQPAGQRGYQPAGGQLSGGGGYQPSPSQYQHQPQAQSQQGRSQSIDVGNTGGSCGPKPMKKWTSKNKPAGVPNPTNGHQQSVTAQHVQPQLQQQGSGTTSPQQQNAASNVPSWRQKKQTQQSQSSANEQSVSQSQANQQSMKHTTANQQYDSSSPANQQSSNYTHAKPVSKTATPKHSMPSYVSGGNASQTSHKMDKGEVAVSAAMAIEATAEIQGVRNRMGALRQEADQANERAEDLQKAVSEMSQKLYETEKERDSYHKQKEGLEDRVFQMDGQLKELVEKLTESDRNQTNLQNDMRAMTEKVNYMEVCEERYKQQVHEATEKAAQYDQMAQDCKRSVGKLQMDNDKLDKDLGNFSDKERQLLHQLKETEDRVVELKSTVARMQTENSQMERAMADSKRMKDKLGMVERKAADYHRHSNLMQQEAETISQELRAVSEKERYLNDKLVEVESKNQQLTRQEERIGELEKELTVYSENHRMMSEQLRECERSKQELDHHVKRLNQENEDLFEASERARKLHEELTECETRCSEYEAKVTHLNDRVESLERQLQEQREAYGELYSQMSVALKDLQHSAY